MSARVFAFLVVATGAALAVVLSVVCLAGAFHAGSERSAGGWRRLAVTCLGAAVCFLGAWWALFG